MKFNEILTEQKKITKTTDFLLPLLGKSKSEMLRFVFNTYLCDVDVDMDWKGMLFILVRFKSIPAYTRFTSWLEEHPYYRGQYDLFNAEFTMYIVEIPEFFMRDYEKFLDGKYSRMSDEAKSAIMKGRPENSTMYEILTRGKQLRVSIENELHAKISEDLELWSRWDERKEEEFFDRKVFESKYFYEDPMKIIINQKQQSNDNNKDSCEKSSTSEKSSCKENCSEESSNQESSSEESYTR